MLLTRPGDCPSKPWAPGACRARMPRSRYVGQAREMPAGVADLYRRVTKSCILRSAQQYRADRMWCAMTARDFPLTMRIISALVICSALSFLVMASTGLRLVNATVQTEDVQVRLQIAPPAESDPLNSAECTVSGDESSSVRTLSMRNAYPTYACQPNLTIANDSNVPVSYTSEVQGDVTPWGELTTTCPTSGHPGTVPPFSSSPACALRYELPAATPNAAQNTREQFTLVLRFTAETTTGLAPCPPGSPAGAVPPACTDPATPSQPTGGTTPPNTAPPGTSDSPATAPAPVVPAPVFNVQGVLQPAATGDTTPTPAAPVASAPEAVLPAPVAAAVQPTPVPVSVQGALLPEPVAVPVAAAAPSEVQVLPIAGITPPEAALPEPVMPPSVASAVTTAPAAVAAPAAQPVAVQVLPRAGTGFDVDRASPLAVAVGLVMLLAGIAGLVVSARWQRPRPR